MKKEKVFSAKSLKDAIKVKHNYAQIYSDVKLVVHSTKGFYSVVYDNEKCVDKSDDESASTPNLNLLHANGVDYVCGGKIVEHIHMPKPIPYTMSRHTYNGKRIRLYV